MGLIIIIAAGVLLALVIFKNAKTVLGLIAIAVFAVIWMHLGNEEEAAKQAAKAKADTTIERSVK